MFLLITKYERDQRGVSDTRHKLVQIKYFKLYFQILSGKYKVQLLNKEVFQFQSEQSRNTVH